MANVAKKRIQTLNIVPLITKWRFFKMARPENYGGSYFKNACAEIPEVIWSGILYAAGLGLVVNAVYNPTVNDRQQYYPYKDQYTVMRPNDPRVKDIRTAYLERNDPPEFDKIFVESK